MKSGIQVVIDCFPEPMVILNTKFDVQLANKAYTKIYGDKNKLIGNKCHNISHASDIPCYLAGEECPIYISMQTQQPKRSVHIHHTSKGKVRTEVEAIPLKLTSSSESFYLEIYRTVDEKNKITNSQKMVGNSFAFNKMLSLIKRVAPSDSVVLLQGESGTGKELVAHDIHAKSKQTNAPFVALECSGLSETLFESELFGHEKGAFTGAYNKKNGFIDAAKGGTLFLDEIGDIPLNLQIKLLRLLETKTYRRVGSVKAKRANFRLICATHRNLKAMVKEGSFRQDLYYRISAFPIFLPPLRERRADLPLLIDVLFQRLQGKENIMQVSKKAMHCLEHYHFPGNIRELRNILERAILLADGNIIATEHLPDTCQRIHSSTSDITFKHLIPLNKLEKNYLKWASIHFKGNKKALANHLGITERTLYRKLATIKTA